MIGFWDFGKVGLSWIFIVLARGREKGLCFRMGWDGRGAAKSGWCLDFEMGTRVGRETGWGAVLDEYDWPRGGSSSREV